MGRPAHSQSHRVGQDGLAARPRAVPSVKPPLTNLLVIAACTGMAALFAAPAIAHNNGYAFPAWEVRQHKLLWEQATSGGDLNIKWGCVGEQRVKMRRGGTGYRHIRCFSSLTVLASKR